mmetsp:Transcript_45040/g.67859  ORF Transcript_45040/g.67859 Transcript_45040/m.67859 type:complete len:108 (+) Transcript_45040:154-477(+)
MDSSSSFLDYLFSNIADATTSSGKVDGYEWNGYQPLVPMPEFKEGDDFCERNTLKRRTRQQIGRLALPPPERVCTFFSILTLTQQFFNLSGNDPKFISHGRICCFTT